MNKRILVFTACYNEKPNIKELIEKIFENLSHSDVLIIDDNSPDQTSLIIKEMMKKYKQINLIVREKKLGLDTPLFLSVNVIGISLMEKPCSIILNIVPIKKLYPFALTESKLKPSSFLKLNPL